MLERWRGAYPEVRRALEQLKGLWKKFPKTFKWLGEINVCKHALAGNGFFSDFTGPRLSVARLESGDLDEFMSILGPAQPHGQHQWYGDRPGCYTCTVPGDTHKFLRGKERQDKRQRIKRHQQINKI